MTENIDDTIPATPLALNFGTGARTPNPPEAGEARERTASPHEVEADLSTELGGEPQR